MTEVVPLENLESAVHLAGNHAPIERFDPTTSSDTTTPSSTTDQQAAEQVIPEIQEEAGLKMKVGQVDGVASEQPKHLLIDGTHGMTVTI